MSKVQIKKELQSLVTQAENGEIDTADLINSLNDLITLI